MSDALSAGRNAPSSERSKSGTVLVVDDNPANCSLLVSILEMENIETVTAVDGVQALACVEKKHPDLILLDVMMAGMNGFEVLRRLKDNALTAGIPVFMVTGLADRESVDRAFDAGADDILTKPVDIADTLARVKHVLASSQPEMSDDVISTPASGNEKSA